MILSTQLSLEFANRWNIDKIHEFIAEYRRVAVIICRKLWHRDGLVKYVNVKELGIETWLAPRFMQGCSTAVLQHIQDIRNAPLPRNSLEHTMPDVSRIEPRLDSRSFKMGINPGTSFDWWLNINLNGFTNKGAPLLRFPLKFTKHFNKLSNAGKMRGSILLSKRKVTFSFELPDPEPAVGQTVGIDIGISTVATSSIQSSYVAHPHGHNYHAIISTLARRKTGSKGFKRALSLRDNFKNWWINRLDFTGVAEVKLENIHNMNLGRQVRRFMRHWNYPKIFRKIESRCAENGVRVRYVDQAYTSQECSSCGAVDRQSRNRTEFRCTSCGYISSADANAALNISRRPQIATRRGECNPSRNQARQSDAPAIATLAT